MKRSGASARAERRRREASRSREADGTGGEWLCRRRLERPEPLRPHDREVWFVAQRRCRACPETPPDHAHAVAGADQGPFGAQADAVAREQVAVEGVEVGAVVDADEDAVRTFGHEEVDGLLAGDVEGPRDDAERAGDADDAVRRRGTVVDGDRELAADGIVDRLERLDAAGEGDELVTPGAEEVGQSFEATRARRPEVLPQAHGCAVE